MESKKRPCMIEQCANPQRSKGYCLAHYKRLLKYGNPLGGSRGMRAKDGEPLKWLLDHLNYEGKECLKWPFADRGNGYGAITIENGRTVGAHSHVCHHKYGPRPSANHVAAHSCGNGHKGCVNPNHLRWATMAENSADRLIHGTDSRGEKSVNSRFSQSDIANIRASYEAGETQVSIAARYKMTQGAVSNIILGKAWSWLK